MIATDAHSVDFAERAMAGALLTGHNGAQRAVDLLGEVETIDIRSPRLRPIIAAALDIRDEGGEPSIGAILDRLEQSRQLDQVCGPDGPGYLTSLMGATPDVWDMATWSRVILDASAKRDATAKLTQLGDFINSDPDRAILTAERLIDSLKGSAREKPQDVLKLIRMSDVEERPIIHLWKNRFFCGKLNMVMGDPSRGKTMAVLDICARVTVGAAMPDGTPGPSPGSVIIMSTEDDAGDTLKPRLRRAGADLSKVYFLETALVLNPKTGKLQHESFDLNKHVPILAEQVRKIGDVKLIVIDPITAYGGKTDSHKNAEVRTMLTELIEMIARHDVCLIGITHMNKGVGGKGVYRATGSLAYVAAARAVWMICEDREDERKRMMLPTKCNISARLDGMAFWIESDFDGPPFVHWDANPVQLSADGYLAQEENSDRKNDQESALTKAVAFLQEQLKDGPMLSKELESAVKANYIAPATYKRARESLNCRAEKDGKIWWTLLPGQKIPKEESQCVTLDNLDALDTVDPHEPQKEPSQEYQQYQEHQDSNT